MSAFAGMTVNERLFHAGLIARFDATVLAKENAEAISILQQIELSREQATETVTAIFENPGIYGYSEI